MAIWDVRTECTQKTDVWEMRPHLMSWSLFSSTNVGGTVDTITCMSNALTTDTCEPPQSRRKNQSGKKLRISGTVKLPTCNKCRRAIGWRPVRDVPCRSHKVNKHRLQLPLQQLEREQALMDGIKAMWEKAFWCDRIYGNILTRQVEHRQFELTSIKKIIIIKSSSYLKMFQPGCRQA